MPSLSGTYRPQTFADITGQDPIKETLRREVETGKVGHAYLFGGPRGIGKTTTARVFAKTLNCLDQKNGEPCNTCPSCVDVNAGKSLDVIEMDAASNTGVDNVREAIIEHVRYTPRGKFKVYILDEAHMLSGSAWNALLKTIEEPPPYAVFLFLTTELHKVPATILSRCQRFDFKRIPNDDLTRRIESITKQEGATISEDVVKTIVSKADGCLRDAESLLGQLLVLGEKKITAEIASLVLPISRLPLAAEMLETWSTRKLEPSLTQIQQIEEDGVPLLPMFDDLIQATRQLLLATDSVECRQRLARGDEGERKLATIVTAYEAPELADIALMLMERRRDTKQGADARFCLELAATAVAMRLLPHATKTEVEHHVPPTPPPAPKVIPPPAPPKPPVIPPTPVQPPPHVAQKEINTEEKVASNITLGQVQGKWPTFLRLVDEKSKSLTFLLKITQPISVEGPVVTFRFQYAFHKEKVLKDGKTKHMVEDCLREATGASDLRIEGIVEEENAEAKESRSQDIATNILKAFGGQMVEEGDSAA